MARGRVSQSDLAELGMPVAVDPPSCGSGQADRDRDGKEEAHTGDTVALLEFFLFAWAYVHLGLFVVLFAAFAGRERDLAVASGTVVLDGFRMLLAVLDVVDGLEARDQMTGILGAELVIVVAVLVSVMAFSLGRRSYAERTIRNHAGCKCSS